MECLVLKWVHRADLPSRPTGTNSTGIEKTFGSPGDLGDSSLHPNDFLITPIPLYAVSPSPRERSADVHLCLDPDS